MGMAFSVKNDIDDFGKTAKSKDEEEEEAAIDERASATQVLETERSIKD